LEAVSLFDQKKFKGLYGSFKARQDARAEALANQIAHDSLFQSGDIFADAAKERSLFPRRQSSLSPSQNILVNETKEPA
jgi:hypothetical protein